MKLLDFIDKYTHLLDFSWIVTRPHVDNIEKKQNSQIPNNIKIINNINEKMSLLVHTQKYDYNTLPKFES